VVECLVTEAEVLGGSLMGVGETACIRCVLPYLWGVLSEGGVRWSESLVTEAEALGGVSCRCGYHICRGCSLREGSGGQRGGSLIQIGLVLTGQLGQPFLGSTWMVLPVTSERILL